METTIPTTEDLHIEHVKNGFPPPQKNNKRYLIIIASALLLVIVIVGMLSIVKNTQSKKTVETNNISPSNNLAKNFKTYKNSFYRFSLDIPRDWVVEEKIINDDRYPEGKNQEFKISSHDGSVYIDNISFSKKNNHIKEPLQGTQVWLGKYEIPRRPYINDDNQRIDIISLYNVDRQDIINFDLNGDVEKNNDLLLKILKSFSFTSQKPSLDEFISYSIPQGWDKVTTDVSNVLTFVSGDLEESGLPSVLKGAKISVDKVKRKPALSLSDQMAPRTFNGEIIKPVYERNVTVGENTFTETYFPGQQGIFSTNQFYKEVDGYVWTITFICNESCNTKEQLEQTPHAKDRDIFLNSLKFKSQN